MLTPQHGRLVENLLQQHPGVVDWVTLNEEVPTFIDDMLDKEGLPRWAHILSQGDGNSAVEQVQQQQQQSEWAGMLAAHEWLGSHPKAKEEFYWDVDLTEVFRTLPPTLANVLATTMCHPLTATQGMLLCHRARAAVFGPDVVDHICLAWPGLKTQLRAVFGAGNRIVVYHASPSRKAGAIAAPLVMTEASFLEAHLLWLQNRDNSGFDAAVPLQAVFHYAWENAGSAVPDLQGTPQLMRRAAFTRFLLLAEDSQLKRSALDLFSMALRYVALQQLVVSEVQPYFGKVLCDYGSGSDVAGTMLAQANREAAAVRTAIGMPELVPGYTEGKLFRWAAEYGHKLAMFAQLPSHKPTYNAARTFIYSGFKDRAGSNMVKLASFSVQRRTWITEDYDGIAAVRMQLDALNGVHTRRADTLAAAPDSGPKLVDQPQQPKRRGKPHQQQHHQQPQLGAGGGAPLATKRVQTTPMAAARARPRPGQVAQGGGEGYMAVAPHTPASQLHDPSASMQRGTSVGVVRSVGGQPRQMPRCTGRKPSALTASGSDDQGRHYGSEFCGLFGGPSSGDMGFDGPPAEYPAPPSENMLSPSGGRGFSSPHDGLSYSRRGGSNGGCARGRQFEAHRPAGRGYRQGPTGGRFHPYQR